MVKCNYISIPQLVKVRKYDVDIESLKCLLRDAKSKENLSINEIVDLINKPKTLVEHWFRKDKYFAIPDDDIWFDLKDLLKIASNEFDKSIMEFEYKIGSYEKSERHYFSSGIAPTITCGEEIKIILDDK